MQPARYAFVVLQLSALAIIAGAQTSPEWRSQAQALFAEARSEASRLPAVYQAQDLSYIANQELLGGVPPGADFEAVFQQARALPASASLVKDQLEPDAVDGLLLAGETRAAKKMAVDADAGRAAILDRLIPAEVAADQLPEAWSLWTAVAPAAGSRAFVAARALLGAPLVPAQRAQLTQNVLAAAGAITSLPEAESATDFLEFMLTSRPQEKPAAAAAALAAARGLNKVPGAGWEVKAIRARLRAIVSAGAPQDLSLFQATLHPTPLETGSGDSRAIRGRRQRQGRPEVHNAPEEYSRNEFAEAAWYAMHRDPVYTSWDEGQARRALKQLRPALAAALPLATVRLAAACFEFHWPRRERRALAMALSAAAARANAYRVGDGISLSAAPELMTFGLAAEIDFAFTAKAAQALHDTPMKPLILAHVARMAQAASQWKPGHTVTVLQ